jgi:hypothetical protein
LEDGSDPAESELIGNVINPSGTPALASLSDISADGTDGDDILDNWDDDGDVDVTANITEFAIFLSKLILQFSSAVEHVEPAPPQHLFIEMRAKLGLSTSGF